MIWTNVVCIFVLVIRQHPSARCCNMLLFCRCFVVAQMIILCDDKCFCVGLILAEYSVCFSNRVSIGLPLTRPLFLVTDSFPSVIAFLYSSSNAQLN